MNYKQLLILFKDTHRELQHKAARSVDTALVIRNWLFGWYIVEFEQGGAERTELYGKNLMNRLSQELKSIGLKGVSKTSLKQCRTFYLAYDKIGQAVPDQSCGKFSIFANAPQIVYQISIILANSFWLGWSHYVTLLTISSTIMKSTIVIPPCPTNCSS